ncbi:MAG: helix-turn-helix domain-containing protein [Alphaproteobacteria bacterium]|nr:helix-turn-helix domain-containing protein [Alphaproteobacteria bacterium]
MKILDIADVAERSGLPPSTLRYYEEIGLIDSAGRHGLRRQYGPETLLQLSLITMGKSAGFSLDEIAGMFGSDGQPDLPRDDLLTRADQLDRQIRDLTLLRNALRHVAECPAPSHMECPTFKRLLKVTTARKKGDQRARKKHPSKR